MPNSQGPLLLCLPQTAAFLSSDVGEIFPPVQCNEDGPFPSRSSLGHRPAQRQWACSCGVCNLQRRTGVPRILNHISNSEAGHRRRRMTLTSGLQNLLCANHIRDGNRRERLTQCDYIVTLSETSSFKQCFVYFQNIHKDIVYQHFNRRHSRYKWVCLYLILHKEMYCINLNFNSCCFFCFFYCFFNRTHWTL